uniref:non-specific serine/threonine protein kinase n=2 Tax=Noccaea caerulescens TaxID=107243 RepID=A0A1J3K3U0_NOCCA
MERHNFPPLISLASFFAVLVLFVHAQDQSGFVSIDCGIPEDSSYNDNKTDIKYVSDAAFVESGIIHSIDPEFQTSSLEKQFQNVRSFPQGKRNCYDVKPPRGKGFKYLIRTRFMYGNYDNLGKAPEFDVYLGVNLWDSVAIDNETTIVTKEIIHTLRSDKVHVCLVDKDRGTPFLSVLEFRLLNNDTYETPYDSLMLYRRWDLGALGDRPVRYKDDVYDRIWNPLKFPNHRVFSTNLTIDPNNNNGFQPARAIMNTASSPLNASVDIILYWEPTIPSWKFYVYMHFAEVQEIKSNETREFSLFWNDNTTLYDSFSPRFLYTDTLYTQEPVTGPRHEFRLQRTDKSTLPPIINAVETYRVNEFLQPPTDQQDVDAIMRIKSKYGVKKTWLGDPCAPVNYPWKDINCSYVDNESPRIISLNLTSSGLSGEINLAFSNLTLIQKLDLSNNGLTGKVPDFLSNLQNLIELNLEGNKLTGALPVKLLERSNNGSLLMRVGGNPNLCVSASCQTVDLKTKKSAYIIPLVASVAGVFGLVIAVALFLLCKKRRQRSSGGVRTGPLDTTKRYYKYSEVVKMTNNFERVLGKGGFGKVYHGVLNDDQVAVKILSESSAQGYKEFKAEVELLLRVHHKNLTALIGYSNQDKKMALIYEFMANGTLGDYLSGKNSYVLSWEERLQISLDAAQGLEYLHNGCKPPIVQRDVKPANILINEKLQAKIADFGLSRSVALDGNNQETTDVAGTIGYLDPEYHSTQKLSEKSDVYSFGVVLLEVVTGQPVIKRSTTRAENRHITDRVGLLLSTGDIRGIVDPKLGESFDAGSAWKITEVAMACASHISTNRPTMSQVVTELKESVSRARADGGSGASNFTEPAMTTSDSGMFPQAR